VCRFAFVSRLALSMEHPVPDFHNELDYRNAKSPAFTEAGLSILLLKA